MLQFCLCNSGEHVNISVLMSFVVKVLVFCTPYIWLCYTLRTLRICQSIEMTLFSFLSRTRIVVRASARQLLIELAKHNMFTVDILCQLEKLKEKGKSSLLLTRSQRMRVVYWASFYLSQLFSITSIVAQSLSLSLSISLFVSPCSSFLSAARRPRANYW